MSKSALDSLVAGGLAVALLFIFMLDLLMGSNVTAPKLEQTTPLATPPRAKKLRLAVTTTNKDKWDNMSGLLDGLGAGYAHDVIHVKELYNPDKFKDFDVLFLTCSSEGNDPALAANVRNFVARGGTLYASDWRFLTLKQAFPDMVDRKYEGEGKDQRFVADIVDPGLRDALGTDKVPLQFDLDQWKTAAFGTDRTKVLMRAKYKTQQDTMSETPLLVKFSFSQGTVIFTSFHNEAQNSDLETKILKYLVFSAVTAGIESEVNQTMLKGGFSPQKSNLLSASKGSPEVSSAYTSKKAGMVRFILGFNPSDPPAKLKLSVTAPDGKKSEKEGFETFVIEQNCAQVGDWRYTITALAVPFPDYPFTITIGEQ